MTEDPTGKTSISLFLPPHELDDIEKKMIWKYKINISAKERFYMQEKVDQYDHIMAFTDGCSLNNPGISGAGCSFYGVSKAPRLKKLELDSSGTDMSEFEQ